MHARMSAAQNMVHKAHKQKIIVVFFCRYFISIFTSFASPYHAVVKLRYCLGEKKIDSHAYNGDGHRHRHTSA